MRSKRLFFVGIPRAHVRASIARAQRLGYEVVLGDREDNLAAAKALVEGADRRVVADYTCTASLMAAARALDHEAPLDAIVTFKEAGAVQTATVAQALGLRTNHPAAVATCNDKSLTHAALAAAGLPTPRWTLCSHRRDVADFFAEVRSALVLKPRDQQGSIGVLRVKRAEQIPTALAACQSASRSPTVLAEEWIKGREVSIEAMIYRGDAMVFGVTEKLLYPDSFVESGHVTPDSGTEMTHEQYRRVVERIAAALRITLGALHIEGFHTRRGFVTTDVHTRYGGDEIVGITEAAAKCDMTSPVFADLGAVPYEVTFGSPPEHAGIKFFDVPPGKVVAIDGVAEASAVRGVLAIEVDLQPGGRVGAITSSFDRPGWVTARAATRSALLGTLEEAVRRIRIVTV